MEWDLKGSSSQWDWEHLMPFSNKGNDSDKNDGGLMGNNASMYSSSSFEYASSGKSFLSADLLANPEPDHCEVKAESMESGYTENRNVGFVDLRSHVQPDHESENVESSRLSLNSSEPGLGTERKDYEPQKEIDQMGQANATGTSTVTDSEIGLRLGKRTYFEDASAIKATPTCTSGAGVVKIKKRGVCENMQPPRCQVEGCNSDLSSCKDYHRRHKVCEIHSKTPKVVVNGKDQRFCQQCSRFHVLSEFDDGKRSCRRRLAGHNERRRKPQPDAMALNSTRLDSSFYDGSRTRFLMDRSTFMHPRMFSSSLLDGHNEFKLLHSRGTWPTILKTENYFSFDGHLQMPAVNQQSFPNVLSHEQADRQLTQSHKAGSGNLLSQGISNYAQSPVNTVAKAQTLTSSSGTGVLGGLEVDSAIESLPGVADSGRALSLLSSHSWGSKAPGSAALDLVTRPGFTSEQFMHGNHSSMNHRPVQEMQHTFGHPADKFLTVSSQSSTGSVSNGCSASAMNTMEKTHRGGQLVNTIGGIVNIESPMHCFLQTQDLRSSQDSRSKDFLRTINLMQRSSQALTNESQEHSGLAQHGNGQYMEFQLMKSYEPPVFDSQHM